MIRNNTPSATDQSSNSPVLAQADVPLRLRFVGSQRHGQVIRINSNKCTIGSAPEATFRLICHGVQPIHCLVLRGSQGMAIRRMSIDTLLNGRTFDDSPLEVGDRISVGPVELEVLPFQSRHESTSQTPPASPHQAQVDHALSTLRQQQAQWAQERSEQQAQLDARARSLDERLHSAEQQSRRAEEAWSQVEQLQDEVNALRTQLRETEDAKRQLEEWSQQQQQAAQELEGTQSQVANLLAQLESAQNELTQKSSSLAATEGELASIQARVAEIESTPPENVLELERRCQQLDDELTSAAQERESLASERQALQEQIEFMKHDTEAQLASQQEQWTQERMALEEQLKSSAAELSTFQARVDDQERVGTTANEQLETLQKQIMEMQAEGDAERIAGKEAYQQLEQTYLRLQEEVETYRNAVSTQEKASAELTEQIHQLQSERDAGRHEVEQLQAQLAAQQQAFETDRQQAREAQGAPHAESVANGATATHTIDVLDRLRAEVEQPTADNTIPIEEVSEQSKSEQGFAEDYTVPRTEEELTFSEPADVAPIDTAAILAKFGHEVDVEDDASSHTQPLDEVSPPTSKEPAASFVGASDQEEEAAIEDYMAQLMQRVGTGEGSPPPRTKDEIRATIPTPTQTPTQAQTIVPEEPKKEPATLAASEFVPRAVAPEASSNLQALRAVANTSARTAIDKHQRRSMDRRALIYGFIAAVCGIVCLSMGCFAPQLISLPALISAIAFVASLLTALRAVTITAKAKLGSRPKPNQKQLPASPETTANKNAKPGETPTQTGEATK